MTNEATRPECGQASCEAGIQTRHLGASPTATQRLHLLTVTLLSCQCVVCQVCSHEHNFEWSAPPHRRCMPTHGRHVPPTQQSEEPARQVRLRTDWSSASLHCAWAAGSTRCQSSRASMANNKEQPVGAMIATIQLPAPPKFVIGSSVTVTSERERWCEYSEDSLRPNRGSVTCLSMPGTTWLRSSTPTSRRRSEWTDISEATEHIASQV